MGMKCDFVDNTVSELLVASFFMVDGEEAGIN
jgi:hypothetical protein